MRILGIDPGLRVTGFGVIDVSGHRLAYVTSGVIRTPTADPYHPARHDLPGRLDHRARTRPRPGRDRKGVRQREPAVDAAARPGARRRDLRPRRGRPAGRRIHGAAAQAGRGRLRPRDQDADAGNGHAAAQPLRPTGPTRPTRSAWRSATRTAAIRSARSAASRRRSRRAARAARAAGRRRRRASRPGTSARLRWPPWLR